MRGHAAGTVTDPSAALRVASRWSKQPDALAGAVGPETLAATHHGTIGAVRAETWERIGRFAGVLRQAGTVTLVARDCPNSLLGAFHATRNALLLCANNLQNDPQEIWEVLAHESAHVMQHCKGGGLLDQGQLDLAMTRIQEESPRLVKELRLYHQSQHRDEVEARLVQGLAPDRVEALFRQFCAERLNGSPAQTGGA